jgi:hypothetical protein
VDPEWLLLCSGKFVLPVAPVQSPANYIVAISLLALAEKLQRLDGRSTELEESGDESWSGTE